MDPLVKVEKRNGGPNHKADQLQTMNRFAGPRFSDRTLTRFAKLSYESVRSLIDSP